MVAEATRFLNLHAMNSFGAIDINPRNPPISAILPSPNKRLESVSRAAFVIV